MWLAWAIWYSGYFQWEEALFFLRDLQFWFLLVCLIFFSPLLDTSTLLIMLDFSPAWLSPGSLLWPRERTRKGSCLWMMCGLYRGMSLQRSIVEGKDILFLRIFLLRWFSYTLVQRQWYALSRKAALKYCSAFLRIVEFSFILHRPLPLAAPFLYSCRFQWT